MIITVEMTSTELALFEAKALKHNDGSTAQSLILKRLNDAAAEYTKALENENSAEFDAAWAAMTPAEKALKLG
jgi:hypothetical protein